MFIIPWWVRWGFDMALFFVPYYLLIGNPLLCSGRVLSRKQRRNYCLPLPKRFWPRSLPLTCKMVLKKKKNELIN